MKNRKLFGAMSQADDKYVEEAAPRRLIRRPQWQKWTAIAACLCLLVTALNPHIGYENAARVAKKAHTEGITLKEACVSLGYLDAAQFDAVFHPEEMV